MGQAITGLSLTMSAAGGCRFPSAFPWHALPNKDGGLRTRRQLDCLRRWGACRFSGMGLQLASPERGIMGIMEFFRGDRWDC